MEKGFFFNPVSTLQRGKNIMSITVRDCLSLPVFKEAKVVGGASGLDNDVKAVSVMETSNLDEMLSDHMKGNEMVITAFFDARDDVPKQCKVIRLLKRGREAAIVLFYVGILVPEIHPDLISAADEVGLPLICMPPLCYDLSYADTISAVMELIIQDRVYPVQLLVNEIISEFSRVEAQQQSLQYAMHLIADKLGCGLIIFDDNLNPLLLANVPDDTYCVLDIATKKFLKQGAYLNQKYGKFDIRTSENSITVHHTPIRIEKHTPMYLYVIDYNNDIYNTIVGQIAEAIKLFASIWGYDPVKEVEARLVQAILNKDNVLVNLLSNRLKISTANLCGLVLIKPKPKSQLLPELHSMIHKIKHDLENLPIRVLTYERQESIEMILVKEKGDNSVESSTLFNETAVAIGNAVFSSSLVAVAILGISGLEQLYEEYKRVERTRDVAQLVYPHKKMFSKYDLRFAEHCLELSRSQNGEINKFKELFKPLVEYDLAHANCMVETLTVFLLDTGLNTQQTAKIIFLHPNTVNYRIKKIKNMLGADITDMPLLLLLSTALAIDRISKDSRSE